jgi:hypothetical protein
MARSIIVTLSICALALVACDTKSPAPADKAAKKPATAKKAQATKTAAKAPAAVKSPAKPVLNAAKSAADKRDPKCQAAVEALKALKKGGKATPEQLKAAVGSAMQVCAKTAAAAPKPTGKPAVPVVAAVPTGTPPKGLEGKWTIDPEGLQELDEFKKLPEQQRKMALTMFKSLKMSIQFGASEIVMNGEFMGQKKAEKTPFTVTKTEGNKITIETDKKGKKETQVLTHSGSRLTIKDGGKTIVLKRIK